MLQKIHENTTRFTNLISESPFYEGMCSSWKSGKGVFIHELSDQSQFLYLFEKDGRYKSYELTEEVHSV